MNIDWFSLENGTTALPEATKIVASTLEVRPVSMARASIALMVHSDADFEVRLYTVTGNLVAKRLGSGNALVEFTRRTVI